MDKPSVPPHKSSISKPGQATTIAPAAVPPRKSSISNPGEAATVAPAAVPSFISSKRSISQLSIESARLKTSIDDKRKKLRHSGSLDSNFWASASDIVSDELDKASVDLDWQHMHFLETGGNEEAWQRDPENTKLQARQKALASKLPGLRHQASRLDVQERGQEAALMRSYVTLFTTSTAGLGVTKGRRRQRSSNDQSNFRQSLMSFYDVRGKGPDGDLIWDVVLGEWLHRTEMTAFHLVPWSYGEATLAAIFGKEVGKEMFSARNGLMLSHKLEEQIDTGFFVIVPDLPDAATTEQRKAWRDSARKDYKIKFINKPSESWNLGHKLSQPELHLYNRTFAPGRSWSTLDGKRLEFRNDHRPRARYLYFLFCVNLLRFAYQFETKAADIIQPEINNFYWGSPKRYVRGTMLPAFVREVGYQFENSFEDPEGEEDSVMREYGEGSDDLLREAATSAVVMATADQEDDDESEDESEDDEESPDYD